MPVILPSTPLASQADLDALALKELTSSTRIDALAARMTAAENRLTKLEAGTPPGPTPVTPSKTGTYITKVSDAPVVDDGYNLWSLVASSPAGSGLQIAVDKAMAPPPAVVDPVTANVVKVGIDLVNGFRRVVQQNAAGSWYWTAAPGAPSATWTQIAGPDGPAPAPGSIYRVQNGRFYAPDGTPFRAKGVNVCYRRLWGDNAVDLGRVSLAALKRAYPSGLNFVRWACHWENPLPPSSDPVARQWVTDLTAAGIIVLVDLHVTGNALDPGNAQANNWLADWAAWGKGNARVWFDTQNEPHGNGISAMMRGQYQAIRSTGNPNPVLLCTGNPGGEITGMNQADFAGMSNVGFDTHCYGWMTPQWPGLLQNLSAFHSADGSMPVICAEFGDGGGSDAQDSNWVANVQTALAHPGGFAAWMVNWAMSPADCLWAPPLDGSVINGGFGQMVHDAIVAA